MKEQRSTSVIGVCGTVYSGTDHSKMNEIFFFLLLIVSVQANSTITECIASGVTAIRCKFPKNINSTRTEFAVYFYSTDGKADLLVDCAWVDDQLQCIEQEGFKCIWPVSDIADISVPTRYLSISGTYSCITEGSSSEKTISCRFHKNQSEWQQEESQGESQKEGNLKKQDDKAGRSTDEIVGVVFGVLALVLLTMAGVFMCKKFFKKNNNTCKSNRQKIDDEHCSFLLTEDKRKSEEIKPSIMTYPSVSSRQRSSSLRKQIEDNNSLEITANFFRVKQKQRSDTL